MYTLGLLAAPCCTSRAAPLTTVQQLLQEELNWEKNKVFMNFYSW